VQAVEEVGSAAEQTTSKQTHNCSASLKKGNPTLSGHTHHMC
jgi:hypothetical protein